MASNFYMYFVAALIPMIVGSVYYNPKTIGGVWMKVNNFTDESLQGANMAVIFIMAYVFSILLAFFLSGMVIHQSAIGSLFAEDMANPDSQGYQDFVSLMSVYGERHRSFGHGAFHGGITAIFFVLPIVGIISLFERRGWKYILIHVGYWFITLVLMGGFLCQFLKFPPIQ